MTSLAPLRALLRIIEHSIDKIEDNCRSRGLDFPLLDEPFTPENDAARLDPVVQYQTRLITAASYQLIAAVQQPQATIFSAMGTVGFPKLISNMPSNPSLYQYYLPVSLRVAIGVHAVEILREAGPQVSYYDLSSATQSLNILLFRVYMSKPLPARPMLIQRSSVSLATGSSNLQELICHTFSSNDALSRYKPHI